MYAVSTNPKKEMIEHILHIYAQNPHILHLKNSEFKNQHFMAQQMANWSYMFKSPK